VREEISIALMEQLKKKVYLYLMFAISVYFFDVIKGNYKRKHYNS